MCGVCATDILKTIKSSADIPYTVLVHVKQLLMLYHHDPPRYNLLQSNVTSTIFPIIHSKQLCVCITAVPPAINLTLINLQCTLCGNRCQPRPRPLCRLLQLCSLSFDACGRIKLLSKSSFLTGALGDNCTTVLWSAKCSLQEQQSTKYGCVT